MPYSHDPSNIKFRAMNEPTGFPNRTDSALTFNSGTRVFTINPTGSSFDIWQQSKKYTITTSDVVNVNYVTIPDTSGTHAIYYDDKVLSQIANPSHTQFDDLILNKVLVSLVYWNATDGACYICADERHGIVMDGRTQEWIHDAIGAVFREGFALSGYTEDTDSDVALTFEVEDGEFYDDDIEHDIDDGTPATQYEQQLNGGDAELPILYRDDVDGSWKEDAATTLPYKQSGVGGEDRLSYNNDDGDGTFSQIEVTDNRWMSMTIVATNDWQYPIKAIQGQNDYTDVQSAVEDAAAEILAFGTLPSPEMIFLYRLVMRTKDTFSGTKSAKIVDVTDFRGSQVSGASAVASDHGALSGLSDDDHAQYLLADGTRDLTGSWAVTQPISIALATASNVPLTLQTTDDDTTKNIFEVKDSGGTALTSILATGNVYTNINSTTALVVEDSGTKDNVFVVDTVNGRVGIGTAAPSALLDLAVATDGGQSFTIEYNDAGNRWDLTARKWRVTSSTGGGFVDFDTESTNGLMTFASALTGATTATLAFQVNQLNRATIVGNSSNNLVFSTRNRPSALTVLDTGGIIIDGTADTVQTIIQAHSTQTANIQENQLSDTTVVSGFDERGILFSDGGIDVNSVYIGKDSGNINHTDAVFNVGIGDGTLNSLTTGDRNVAIGSLAGTGITTGEQNMFIGRSSGSSVTTGSRNMGMGQSAAIGGTGSDNVAIGANAIGIANDGSNNVAIGSNALQNVTGSGNVAIGRRAGLGMTSTNNSILIGHYAGYRQTTADNLFLVDNRLRADAAEGLTNSILYGVMAATPANQTLRINAATTIGFTTASALTIGVGTAGIDYNITFNGETNDGVLTWMEDEDQFVFADAVDVDAAFTATTVDADTDFTVGDTVITDGVITDTTGLSIVANTAIAGTLTATSYGGITEANLVDKSASESIGGEWTFGVFPITPSAAPDANYEVANKKYVDDAVVTGGGATVALDNLAGVAINESLISDTDNTDDLGSAAKEWKDLFIDGTATIDALVADTADINAGTIDGTTIGAAVATSIIGTTIDATTDFTIGDTVITDGVITDATGLSLAAEITVADGSSINLQEAVTFTGATTENIVEFPDTLAVALAFKEGANSYLTFVSSNGSEKIESGKKLDMGDNEVEDVKSLAFNDGGATVTIVHDEDAMGSDSPTALATQQSIKAYVDAMWSTIYPVGAIYTSIVSTSPQTLFGGTWVAFGTGRVLVSLDSGDGDFDTAEETGGAKTHTLTEAEMPAHIHSITGNYPSAYGGYGQTTPISGNAVANYGNKNTDSTGDDGAHDNVQPYIVVYMWKRTV